MTKEQIYLGHHSITLIRRMVDAKKRKDGISCVVLAMSVCEAFINDMQQWYQFAVNSWPKPEPEKKEKTLFKNTFKFICGLPLTGHERDIANVLIENEKTKKSTTEKYVILSKFLTGNGNIAGTSQFQQLKLLTTVRNEIVHSKGTNLKIYTDEQGQEKQPTENQYPSFLKMLFKNEILELPKYGDSWFYLLDTDTFCDWVVKTVTDVVYNTIELLPKEPSTTQHFYDSFFVYSKKKEINT